MEPALCSRHALSVARVRLSLFWLVRGNWCRDSSHSGHQWHVQIVAGARLCLFAAAAAATSAAMLPNPQASHPRRPFHATHTHAYAREPTHTLVSADGGRPRQAGPHIRSSNSRRPVTLIHSHTPLWPPAWAAHMHIGIGSRPPSRPPGSRVCARRLPPSPRCGR